MLLFLHFIEGGVVPQNHARPYLSVFCWNLSSYVTVLCSYNNNNMLLFNILEHCITVQYITVTVKVTCCFIDCVFLSLSHKYINITIYVTVRIDIKKIYTLTSKYICSLTDLFMSIFTDHISEFRKVFWLMSTLSGTVSKFWYMWQGEGWPPQFCMASYLNGP